MPGSGRQTLSILFIVELTLIALGLAAVGLVVLWIWRHSEEHRRGQRAMAVLREESERTARELAERAEEAGWLSEALSRADFGVMIVGRDGVIRFINAPASQFLDARHGEAVAEVRIRELLGETLGTDQPSERELELYTPVRRALRLRAFPRPGDGGAILYVEDLTERRRLDEVRRDFVANVGHELKTPIGALSILVETLSETPDDPEVTERLVRRLELETSRLSELVEDLLDLTEVESREGDRNPVRFGEVLEDALVRLGPDADGRVDVDLTEADPDLLVRGDRRQLASALFNLVDNAIKYSLGRGTVRVRATPGNGLVRVEVEDEGVGIPSSHQERIFERFYRIDQARTGTPGSGLGLAIVKHVALNHGGSVGVESEEGVGSRFWLELPSADG